ncbi:acyl-CoA thioesterase [Mangrovibacterium sp.]|uniref:acyl-CoA thioesterase n=1 Tax=Mangrovibacterium sp. TaxID=1961364 RepID=UPI0035674D11
MLIHKTKLRVYYEDTDKMGVVYYGNYPRYYEIGRTELIRSLGVSYKEMEDSGIMLPASSLKVNYIKSAYYDDLLTIVTIVDKIPQVKFPIRTEIYNEQGELINEGETVLAFFDRNTGKPCRAPKYFVEKIAGYFKP